MLYLHRTLFAIRALAVRNKKVFSISIVDSNDEIMKGFNQKVRLTIIQALKAAKIEFMTKAGG